MSYRFPDPNPVQFTLDGTEPAAGGSIRFYDYQTTTPKATYDDRDLTTPNPNPVPLDASGRPSVEVWLDGEYTAVLYEGPNATGDVVWTKDIVPEIPAGATLPDPNGQEGKVPMSDGSQYVLSLIREVPDGTGQAGYMLVADPDGNPIWQPQPEVEIPDPEVVVSASGNAGSVRVGTSDVTTKSLVQWGVLTVAPSGTPTATGALTFPTPFASGCIPHVTLTVYGNTQPGGPVVTNLTGTPNNLGGTVQCDVAEGLTGNVNIVNSIPVAWQATGYVTVS